MSLVVATALGILLVGTPLAFASVPVQGGCVKEVSGFSVNCTANDVTLTDIVPGSLMILDDGCTSTSDTVTFTARGIFKLTGNQERFDIGIFIATDGDPNGDGAKSGLCSRDLVAFTPDPPYVNLDPVPLDTCGDIDKAHSPLTQDGEPTHLLPGREIGPVTISCANDADNDGKVDIDHCETWNQPGANTICLSALDVKAGSPAKCNCARLPGACIAFPDNNECTRDVCQGTCSNSPSTTCESNANCPSGGTCQNLAPAHVITPGAACGDPADTVCDNPDRCDSGGACQANNEPGTVVCRADDGECDVAENCAAGGVCPADSFEAAGFACGSPLDTVCDNPDTCNATGQCANDNNEPNGTSCNDSDACTSPDTCQGGVCTGASGSCKVTGGGQLTASGSFPWVSFGFNVQTGSGTKGQLELNRHTTPKAAYHSIQIGEPTPLMITSIIDCNGTDLPGQEATFTGTIRRKGQAEPCDFTAVVKDCGEPGRNDYFEINITGPDLCDESRSGTLDRGNIQIH